MRIIHWFTAFPEFMNNSLHPYHCPVAETSSHTFFCTSVLNHAPSHVGHHQHPIYSPSCVHSSPTYVSSFPLFPTPLPHWVTILYLHVLWSLLTFHFPSWTTTFIPLARRGKERLTSCSCSPFPSLFPVPSKQGKWSGIFYIAWGLSGKR